MHCISNAAAVSCRTGAGLSCPVEGWMACDSPPAGARRRRRTASADRAGAFPIARFAGRRGGRMQYSVSGPPESVSLGGGERLALHVTTSSAGRGASIHITPSNRSALACSLLRLRKWTVAPPALARSAILSSRQQSPSRNAGCALAGWCCGFWSPLGGCPRWLRRRTERGLSTHRLRSPRAQGGRGAGVGWLYYVCRQGDAEACLGWWWSQEA